MFIVVIYLKLRWTSNNFSILKFIFFLFIIGFFIGIYVYLNQIDIVKESVVTELNNLNTYILNSKQNNFIFHIILLCILMVASISCIGLPLILFYLFYEGISAGFLLASLYGFKKLSGITFGIFYLSVTKILYLFLITYLVIVSIRYAKEILINLKNNKKDLIINQLIKCFFVLIMVLLNDVFLYFLGNKIIKLFITLI